MLDDRQFDAICGLLERILKLQLIKLEGETLPSEDLEIMNEIREYLAR